MVNSAEKRQKGDDDAGEGGPGMERANSMREVEQPMSKRQKQTAFLRTLILHGDGEMRAQLQGRIKQAERDELCVWRALWLVSLLAVLSCVGICYSAVLIPEFFRSSSHFVVRFFFGLGLASMVCAAVFLGFWMWCRGVLNRVQEDCRRFVMATLEAGGRPNYSPSLQPARSGQRPATHTLVESWSVEQGPTALPRYQRYSQLFSLRRLS